MSPVPPAPRPRRWVGLITPRVVATMVVVVGLSLLVAQMGIFALRSIRADTLWVQQTSECRGRLEGLLRLARLATDDGAPAAADLARRQLNAAAAEVARAFDALERLPHTGPTEPGHGVADVAPRLEQPVRDLAAATTPITRAEALRRLEPVLEDCRRAVDHAVTATTARVEDRVNTFASLQILLVVVAAVGLLGALWSARELYRRERDAEQAQAAAAALQAQEHLARLGRMAAVVAHEVRNPLAALQTSLGVLQFELPQEAERAHATVTELRKRIHELDTLVTDILRFARPAAPRRQRQSLRAVLEGAWSSVAGDDALAHVAFELQGADAAVDVDGPLLGRAIANLYLNAGQAMGGQGAVEVQLSQTNGHHRVLVRDHGPGLAPEARARLFEPFVTTKTRGTGLGLAIARRIVEAHDGRLTLEDATDGPGTVATVTLPSNA